ncbi:MAG: Ni/Fe hydrogenase subunit alpha [Spirochaetes bacterium]|nr:Ni/Fe hydrogenase subunit alpha [Spirochaetota bacterium]
MGDKKIDLNIAVKYLTRVEGHGNIKIDVKSGQLKECNLEIVEAPRFFESFLRGRHYTEAPFITSRICGICGIGHTLASIRAVEDALNIKITEQTRILRQVLNNAEHLQSHCLHIYFLVAPDLYKASNVFTMAAKNKELALIGLRLKKLANDMGDVFGGRTIHPITPVVGGFTDVPTRQELKEILERLKKAGDDIQKTAEIFKKEVKFPDYERHTEYISLKNNFRYAFNEGDIYSSDTKMTSYKNYRDMTNENVVPHSTAKHASHARNSFMVGALARFNNNYEQLEPSAKKLAKELGLRAVCHRPYMITVAQLVEVEHCRAESIRIIEKFLKQLPKYEKPVSPKPNTAGEGVGAVEVPRGILYHNYHIDKEGMIKDVNCIIPTGQNMANIEQDMREFLPAMFGKSQEEITLLMEMLVRAYDPCISCSAHFLEVDFV